MEHEHNCNNPVIPSDLCCTQKGRLRKQSVNVPILRLLGTFPQMSGACMTEAQLLDIANLRITELEADVFVWRLTAERWMNFAKDQAVGHMRQVVKMTDAKPSFPARALGRSQQPVGLRTL
jgi:hypothetical protein